MDFMRDLLAAGGVSAALAQDHDRFAREPAYLSYVREAFGQHGCKLRVLTDRGDDCSEGRLTDGNSTKYLASSASRWPREVGGVSHARQALWAAIPLNE
jgi:hypothetical protein